MPNEPTLPDNPTEADLEAATNATMGDYLDSPLTRANAPDPQPDATPAAPQGTPQPGSGAEPTPPTPTPSTAGQGEFSDEEKSLLNELRALKEMSGTPFKTPADLVKAYKELQRQWTGDHDFVTRAKPLEHLVTKANQNPAYLQFLEQATQFFDNPQLAAPYAGQAGGVDAPPDPRAYNLYDAEDYARFNQDNANYMARNVDSRINARFSQTEAKARLDSQKADLVRQFPGVNADEVIARIQERAKQGWSITDGYKVIEWENMKARALEEARGELNKQLAEAGRTGTPTPSAASQKAITFNEIVEYFNKYGSEATIKKFGERNYNDALRIGAEVMMS